MGRSATADLTTLIDLENWLLVRSGVLRYSSSELDDLPIATIHNFIGFELGVKEREKFEREVMERKQKLNELMHNKGNR